MSQVLLVQKNGAHGSQQLASQLRERGLDLIEFDPHQTPSDELSPPTLILLDIHPQDSDILHQVRSLWNPTPRICLLIDAPIAHGIRLAREWNMDGFLSRDELPDVAANRLRAMLDANASNSDSALRQAISEVERLERKLADLSSRFDEQSAQRAFAERNLRDTEAIYHSLVESLPINLFRKDRDGHFTFANKLFCNELGVSQSELIGKTDFDFFPHEDATKYRANDAAVIEQGKPFEDVEEHRTPDGKELFVHVLKVPFFDSDGNPIGVQAVYWDVTARIMAERQMEHARQAAEHANQAKSDFLANMSHEIRTPMNAIMGMTELVLSSELTMDQREHLEIVQGASDSLLALIDDILDFSKIEAGKLDLESTPFSLGERLGDTMKTLALRAHQKNLELAFRIAKDVPRVVVGDSHRIRQIIVNLVGNAIKFTEQGEVVLDVSLVEAEDTEVKLHFVVADTGIGISAKQQKTIFQAFEQADTSMTRRFGGTGLGLAISSRLVQLMGGRLWVESEQGVGSQFHFELTLPLGDEADEVAPVNPVHVRGARALVIDDNETNRRILEEMTTNWGMFTTSAESANIALEIIEEAFDRGEPFSIVITDASMPEVDGFQLVEKLRSDSRFTNVPVLMLTSADRPGDIQRCQTLGIKRRMIKPVKQSELLQTIESTLGSWSQRQSDITDEVVDDKLEPLRILLAEDSRTNQLLAVALLTKAGHSVDLVETGREAVEQTAKNNYDVVLMDIQMPEMDGLEATRAIRKRESVTKQHIPIVAMTAHAMKGDEERCLANGMDGYLSKPIKTKEFFATLRSLGKAAGEVQVCETIEIDWKVALHNVGGHEDILEAVINSILLETPQSLENLRVCVDQHDYIEAKRHVHTIRGNLRPFELKRITDLGKRIEQLCGADDPDAEVPGLLPELADRLNEVLAALKSRSG